MKTLSKASAITALALLLCTQSALADIGLNPGGATTQFFVRAGQSISDPLIPGTFPFTDLTHSIGAAGNAVSQGTYSFNHHRARLDHVQTISNTPGTSLGTTASAQLIFVSDVDVPYFVTGTASAAATGDGFLRMEFRLLNTAGPVPVSVFHNRQTLFMPPDATLNIGEAIGLSPILSGSRSGMLLANNRYQIEFDLEFSSLTNEGSGSAIGTITFLVPEPGSALLAGVMGMGIVRRRSRTKI